ncbi:hypothetical protein [Tatumella sp. OPLPL6]|uniref:hypothetical protein n=1 Tax=Tatumella sp. OPLPL6 TaxID=1928657 RepID=UPI000C1957E1|nr:hypothetical protein [Tatumella sp. OPLPL6]PIJ43305.1 hypothetical protein BOM24_09055 [Tatumella sp. OPLPL6]
MEKKLNITFDTRWLALKQEFEQDPVKLAFKLFPRELNQYQKKLITNKRIMTAITYCSGSGTTKGIAILAVLNMLFKPECPVNIYLLDSHKSPYVVRLKKYCFQLVQTLIQSNPWIKLHLEGSELGIDYKDASHGEGLHLVSMDNMDGYLDPFRDSEYGALRIVTNAHRIPEKTFRMLMGFIVEEDDRLVMISHPDDGESDFKTLFIENPSHIKTLTFKAIDSGLIGEAYLEQMTKKYPVGSKEYQRRFYGEW